MVQSLFASDSIDIVSVRSNCNGVNVMHPDRSAETSVSLSDGAGGGSFVAQK